MKGKSPAFQFYPDAWLSSTSVSLMTPAEEGAYLRLLCHAWLAEDCGLPDDDAALAELSRLRGQWKKSGPRIRAKFEAIGGRLFNARLVEERQKQIEWSAKSSFGGKKSAAARAEAKLKGGSTVVDECLQPYVEPNLNISSSSSSSSSKSQNLCSAGAEPGLFPFDEKRAVLQMKPAYGKAWCDTQHDAWYTAYWNHTGKAKSRLAYEKRVQKLAKNGKGYEGAAQFLLDECAAYRQRFEATDSWSWRVRLHPSTWLNGELWTDEEEPEIMSATERAMASI